MKRTPTPLTLRRFVATIRKYKIDLGIKGRGHIFYVLRDVLDKMRRLLFSLEKYYLYKYNLKDRTNITRIQPKVDNIRMLIFLSKISMEEFEVLVETGYDFRHDPSVSEYIDGERGIIIFCGLVNEKLAYQACASNYRTGVYQHICPPEYDLRKIAYQGLNVTTNEFRRKGLYTWGQCEMLRFFKDHGYDEMMMLEANRLEDMRRIHDRIGSEILYRSYCLRLLLLLNYRWNKPYSRREAFST